MINDYLVYVTLAFAVTALPGPAVILTIKNSIQYGYKIALANIIGNFIAMIILASLSALGLGAIILASSALFSAIKIAGCVYLFYLGVKVWNAPHKQNKIVPQNQTSTKEKTLAVFKEGFGVGIANPKAIAFFTALFPQFIDPAAAFIPQFLTLIFTIEGISFLVLTTYAFFSSAASPYLSREKPMMLFNKLTGAAFIGFGLTLIYEK